MNSGTMVELPLDENLLKVLSSESRREILRLLAERRMTGAELAQRLNLGKPAVSEHLQKLQQANLILRADDPERRWVYYELTPQGRDILEPKRVRFYLVLGVAIMALVAGIALALGYVSVMGGSIGPAALDGNPGDDGTDGLGLGLPGALGDANNVTRDALAAGLPRPEDGPIVVPVPIENQTVIWYVTDGQDDANAPTVLRLVVGESAATPHTTAPASPGAPVPSTAPSTGLVPPISVNATLPTGTVYVFSAADVDLANGTVTVHAVNSTLAGTPSSDLVAMEIPGAGLVPVATSPANATTPTPAAAMAFDATMPLAAPADAPASPAPTPTASPTQSSAQPAAATSTATTEAPVAAPEPTPQTLTSSQPASPSAPTMAPADTDPVSPALVSQPSQASPSDTSATTPEAAPASGNNAISEDAAASEPLAGVTSPSTSGDAATPHETLPDRTPKETIPFVILLVGAVAAVALRMRKA